VTVELFAGISVRDRAASLPWYERFLGSEPAFYPNDVEAVWELAAHRYLYIEERTEHAGHSHQTLFLEDFEDRIAAIAARGIEPDERETYDNGVRHVTYRDPDGNEISFGGAPLAGQA
jgi:catechol 2,3-dioxygenase-like lactoylglutathione lyase family enzyme